MAKRTIVTLPGDGIGSVVLEQAIRVLDAAGFDADYIHGDIGWEFWCKEGNPLPERTLNLLKNIKLRFLEQLLQNQMMKQKLNLIHLFREKDLLIQVRLSA